MPPKGNQQYKEKNLNTSVIDTTKNKEETFLNEDLLNLSSSTDLQIKSESTGKTVSVGLSSLEKSDLKGSVIVAAKSEKARSHTRKPKYIGFDISYTEEKENDSKRMVAVRRAMAGYYKAKADFDANIFDKADGYERLIASLEELTEKCEIYRFFRQPIFTVGLVRKAEVEALQKEAEGVLLNIRKEYVDYTQEQYNSKIHADPKLSYREGRKEKVPEAKLEEVEGSLRAIKIDDLKKVDGEYEHHTYRSFIKNKAKFDLARRDISFTLEEKKLLRMILSYSEKENELKDMSYRLGSLNNMFYDESEKPSKLPWWLSWLPNVLPAMKCIVKIGASYLNNKKEISEYSKIMPELKRILASRKLSAKKRKVFETYLKRFETFDSGKLDLTGVPEEKIMDFTGAKMFYTSEKAKSKDNKDGGAKEDAYVFSQNRTGEPLFTHVPSITDINQLIHGNCFFLGAVAELVAKDPFFVVNMLKDEGSGGVVVKLWHNESPKGQEPSLVPVYYRVDKNVSRLGSTSPLWVDILMNAMTAHWQTYPDDYGRTFKRTHAKDLIEERKKTGIKFLDYGILGNGGDSAEALMALTGKVGTSKTVAGSPLGRRETAKVTLAKAFRGQVTDLDMSRTEKELKEPEKDFWAYNMEVQHETRLVFHFKDISGELIKDYEKNKKELSDELSKYDGEVQRLKEIINREKNAETGELSSKGKEAEKSLKNLAMKLGRIIENTMLKCGFYNRHEAQQTYLDNVEFYDHILEDDQETMVSWTFEVAEKQMVEAYKEMEVLLQQCSDKVLDTFFEWQGGKDIADKYKSIYENKEIKDFPYRGFPKPSSKIAAAVDNPFKRLSIMMHITEEQAYEIAKKHMLRTLEMYLQYYQDAAEKEKNEFFTGVYSKEALSLYDQIKTGTDQGKLYMAGTNNLEGKKTTVGETLNYGIAGGHAYSVLGVQEVKYGDKTIKMVRMRNPWGYYKPQYYLDEKTGKVLSKEVIENDGGIFLVELTHFWKTMSNIYEAG